MPVGGPVPAASPENIHTSKILRTLQVMFRNTYAHINTYAIQLTKEVIDLKEMEEAYMAGLVEEEERCVITKL